MANVKQWPILLPIVFLLLHPATCSSNITCSAGKATIGGPATVTCFFNRDIKSSKQGFVIRRYPFKATNSADSTIRKDVLRCNWVEGAPLDCQTATGYEFNGDKVITTASVDIPSATADQEGMYECQLATQENLPISTCNLTVQATEGNDATSNIDTFINSDLTPLGSLILIIGLIIIVIIVIIVITYYCCKYTCRRKPPPVPNASTADRGNDTSDLTVKNVVEIAVDTKDLDAFVAASKGWFSRSTNKTPPKQSTPKCNQENLEEKKEEQPLLPTTIPPGEGEPTLGAVGWADVATMSGRTSSSSGASFDTFQDNILSDSDMALTDTGKSSDGKKRKKGLKATVSLFLHKK